VDGTTLTMPDAPANQAAISSWVMPSLPPTFYRRDAGQGH